MLESNMVVAMHASLNQLRWWLTSAPNGQEDLDPEAAIENAGQEIAAALEYLASLDAAEDAVAVLGVVPVEARINPKRRLGDL